MLLTAVLPATGLPAPAPTLTLPQLRAPWRKAAQSPASRCLQATEPQCGHCPPRVGRPADRHTRIAMCPTPLRRKFPNALLVLKYYFLKSASACFCEQRFVFENPLFLSIPQPFSLILGFQKGKEWAESDWPRAKGAKKT